MSSTYKVQVNKSSKFELTEGDVLKINTIKTNDHQYHILHNNKSFYPEIIKSNFNSKNYTVQINGNSYQVDISDQLDQLIDDMGFSLSASKLVNAIKAPMPGLLLDIHIEVGQEVAENDSLLVLEAMKMENVIMSPRDGIIKSISATKGDAVDKGQLLIEFE